MVSKGSQTPPLPKELTMGGTFFKETFGVEDMSRDDLDKIALRGGKIGSIGYGYAQWREEPAPRYGYGFRWINTKGVGNHGDLILVPRSPRAAEFLRTGRVEELMREFGISRILATRLDDARKGVKFGKESAVVKTVLEGTHVNWGSFPGVGAGAARWARRWGIEGLSCPRLGAAALIGQRLYQK
jgi:hypothetical protein